MEVVIWYTKKTVTTPVTETKYTASDGRVFKNEDEAELHEKLLENLAVAFS